MHSYKGILVMRICSDVSVKYTSNSVGINGKLVLDHQSQEQQVLKTKEHYVYLCRPWASTSIAGNISVYRKVTFNYENFWKINNLSFTKSSTYIVHNRTRACVRGCLLACWIVMTTTTTEGALVLLCQWLTLATIFGFLTTSIHINCKW